MKNVIVLPALTVLALIVSGCSSTPPDTRAADAKALKDLEAQWNQDFAARDAEKLSSHYADDAVLIMSGAPSITTKVAIRRALIDMAADPALTVKFQSVRTEVAKAGDLAYQQGTYTMTMTDPRSKRVINDHGSYVTDFRKQSDGTWKAVADIVTSEVPPPSSEPAPEKVKAKAKPKAKGKGKR